MFVCVATLAIVDRLDEIDQPTLCWWLSERQLSNGGLNGRPEKLEDVSFRTICSAVFIILLFQVCYSFWVLSALSILGKLTWIDASKLEAFILSAQETESGGIADRPGDVPDVFHTLFGIAGTLVWSKFRQALHCYLIGLSLLGYPGLMDLDPVYCMPASIVENVGLRKGWKALQRRTS